MQSCKDSKKHKDIFKACVSKQLVWYSIHPTIYIFLPLVLTDVFSHGRGGGVWAKDVYQAVHQINSLIHMIWSDTIKTHHITSVSKGSTCQFNSSFIKFIKLIWQMDFLNRSSWCTFGTTDCWDDPDFCSGIHFLSAVEPKFWQSVR